MIQIKVKCCCVCCFTYLYECMNCSFFEKIKINTFNTVGQRNSNIYRVCGKTRCYRFINFKFGDGLK